MINDNDIIFIPDFMILLLYLKDKTNMLLGDIQKETDIAYSHLYKMKRVFIDKEYISITIDEKKHLINITKKGLRVVDVIELLLKNIEIDVKDVSKYRRLHKEREQDITTTETKSIPPMKKNNEDYLLSLED